MKCRALNKRNQTMTNLVQATDNTALEPLIMEFRRLNNRKEASLRKSNFKLSELIRDVAPVSNGTLTPYSNYIGSLTTPECSEVTLTSLLDILI